MMKKTTSPAAPAFPPLRWPDALFVGASALSPYLLAWLALSLLQTR